MQLEEQAYPYEEKAAEMYKAAMTRADELGIFDKWVGLARMRLSVLEPWNYELLESEIFVTVNPPGPDLPPYGVIPAAGEVE